MRRNGKSFWFASLFLPRQTARDAARLYAFCRNMDDLADEAVTEQNREILAGVRNDLQRGVSANPVVTDFLALAQKYDLPRSVADHLIATFIADASTKMQVEDVAELVRYCYGVAGTVGLLMAPILGADQRRAGEAAIHLGVAMQMTNIARDVLEDARNGRRYLPGCWIEHSSAQEIVASTASRQQVSAAIERLLALADQYYASAAKRFALIPSPARRAIQIAAAVYREIGTVLHCHQFAWWEGRVSVSLSRKFAIALSVCLGWTDLARFAIEPCILQLSQPLTGLPGAP